ncbi:type II toxin-antitoxin system RelE/ParE family toxin [Xanthomonas phaseoli]|uniref:Plasmid stabilization protein n=1 Tax=Xanthomonas campestris pv. phaseoli TaxID=317013 RepID=A0AB38E554_XANCH|nr:type II toxin-antitoxin system RelE/ParE family toxin [Xanthomonas phaseoli]UZB16557.1 type II toxin-antitoxin system RelE/ParE family toxin [Xanthomonas phaseoli pv. phaseoli]UZB20709.1 type II toxin-antitoxin system RelE/ParE family toxin [Xanthomonas phaseoli pv. phaseoli]SON85029.1 hypothetical protein XAP6984_600008 [Xanthomonas phaseoli pv. phaseoli]SON87760.1 hypothetical protein XAP412_550009 [Xanthomonas phaseoli pv. phaseoli]SON91416.1 hypothetical protein XAP7430_560008 [Xanthomo
MAEIIWSVPALADLDAIADYIAIDNAPAAAARVKRVFAQVERLIERPDRGSRPQELTRQLSPDCRTTLPRVLPRGWATHRGGARHAVGARFAGTVFTLRAANKTTAQPPGRCGW